VDDKNLNNPKNSTDSDPKIEKGEDKLAHDLYVVKKTDPKIKIFFAALATTILLVAVVFSVTKDDKNESSTKAPAKTSNKNLANTLAKTNFKRVAWFGPNYDQYTLERENANLLTFNYNGGTLKGVKVYNNLENFDDKQVEYVKNNSKETIVRKGVSIYLPDFKNKQVGKTTIYYFVFNDPPRQFGAVSLPEPNFDLMRTSAKRLMILTPAPKKN
jgi:hypothetical protein